MELTPKDFQLKTLDRVAAFFSDAFLLQDPAVAFARHLEPDRGLTASYTALRGMEHAPSVCLRVPTGGGKTMLAAMAIGRMARALAVERPIVLWLTPGSDIRSQTLRALQNRDHPYRRALWNDWGDRVQVHDIADFASITPQDLEQNLTVVVCTRQSLQVENTEGRRVYANNENLEPHFRSLPTQAAAGLERNDPGSAFAGSPKFSFVNLLKLHRPLVIVDEAHQFLTPLALEVRQRLGARALLELTATPKHPSNVLLSVSATQLKQDKLIKLPVVLAEHTGAWQTAVSEAVATRRRLAERATAEPDYIRPLLLIQAQNEGQSGDWQAIKQYLLEAERLAPEEIAVHTGNKRELEGVDLFSRKTSITTIITVQALKEGWDCSFAYVLCSVANIGHAGEVEQWLGRVLRMPYARDRQGEELRRAYVHAATERFQATADAVRTGLQDMGFEEYEAKAAIEDAQGDLPLFQKPLRLILPAAPDVSGLPQSEAAAVAVDPAPFGQVGVSVQGPVSDALLHAVLAQVPVSNQLAVVEQIRTHNQQWEPSPAQRGLPFTVARLTIEVETGDRLPFDNDILEELVDVDLREHPQDLLGFRYDEGTRRYLVDVAGDHLNLDLLGETALADTLPVGEFSRTRLAAWLSAHLRTPFLNASALDAWVLHALSLCEGRGNTLPVLDRARFVLLRLLEDSLGHIRSAARRIAYQTALFARESSALTSDEWNFQFPPTYPARFFCERSNFRNHYYRAPGELENDGEEYNCAVEIDHLPGLRYWVRNLAGPGREASSFWLQTWTQRFYPDFVALLEDGRTLVVEYKGHHLENNPDELAKREIGELWAKRSGGRCLFLWAVARDHLGRDVRTQLRAAIT